jgi:hypothetical protein
MDGDQMPRPDVVLKTAASMARIAQLHTAAAFELTTQVGAAVYSLTEVAALRLERAARQLAPLHVAAAPAWGYMGAAVATVGATIAWGSARSIPANAVGLGTAAVLLWAGALPTRRARRRVAELVRRAEQDEVLASRWTLHGSPRSDANDADAGDCAGGVGALLQRIEVTYRYAGIAISITDLLDFPNDRRGGGRPWRPDRWGLARPDVNDALTLLHHSCDLLAGYYDGLSHLGGPRASDTSHVPAPVAD